MKKVILLLGLVLTVAVWYALEASETARVKKAFNQAAVAFRKDGTEAAYTSLSKSRALAALVGSECRLEIPERNYVSAMAGSDLAREIALFRAQSTRIKVAFEDLSVQLVDETTAQATCDFFYSGDADPLGFLGRDARALEATLKKAPGSGNWRFAHVRLMPILRK